MPFTRPSKKRLEESNILVKRRSGSVPYRVVPLDALRDPVKRYLPPAGRYYDQSTLERFADVFDHEMRCVLCWNMKVANQKCKCENNCAVCDTKQHRGRECHMLYADFKWWQARGHRLRKKAQLRPHPGERAHLVVANVVKDWKKLKSAVVVNMDDPDVKAFYEGKESPQTVFQLPQGLRTTPAATTRASSTTNPLVFEANVHCAPSVANIDSCNPKKTIVQPEAGPDSAGMIDFDFRKARKGSKAIPATQIGFLSANDDDSLKDLLKDTWQPPSHHEGRQYSTMTPLSLRLALVTAQQSTVAHQPFVSNGNEIRMQSDPRLRARTHTQGKPHVSQPLPETRLASAIAERDAREVCTECELNSIRQELEEVREEIRAKDRRIQELELALHEAEGWTDAVTYRAGQKRSN